MFNRDDKLPAYKLTVVQYVIMAILLVLISGLWRLQILGAQNYHELAEQNRIRKVPILAPRGRLLDRDGRLLVDNYPSISCFLIRDQVKDVAPDLPRIAAGLNMTVEQIQTILDHYKLAAKYQPLPLKSDITPDEEEFIEAHREELPELETIDEQRRLYPRDGFAAHMIGYVGEVSEDMLNDPRYAYYEPGDVVGKSGIEQSYDSLLRGTDGSRDVLVDSHGREVGRLGSEHATPGKDLKLTIDIDVQRAAEHALNGRNGAMIAMDPHTGEVLALVSRPTFDPNEFSVRITRNQWSKYVTDPDHPLLNKAIQAQLAPGSTFKILMSVAGLQEGIAESLNVHCGGGGTFYGRYFKCWFHAGHGSVNISKAIFQSCDVFFYTLAERLGIETISKWAHAMGLGQKTGIDLPNEVTGVMPSEEWKMKNYHQKFYAGEVISVGIGQGAVAATPVQMARAIGGIASGGVLKRPHLVFTDELTSEYRQAMLDSYPGTGDATIPLAAANWETITDAMAQVLEPVGTDPSAHLQGIDFAGKTGSAQTMSNALAARMGHSKSVKDNAWFVGVSPRRNPDIVVCVLFEGGEHGKLAGRLAAQVIEAFVNKQRKIDRNVIEVRQAAPALAAPAGSPAHNTAPGTAFLIPSWSPQVATPRTEAARPAESQLPADQPSKTKVKTVDVGALWSDPAAPEELGGRRVPAVAVGLGREPLPALHAGHFELRVEGETRVSDARRGGPGSAGSSALRHAARDEDLSAGRGRVRAVSVPVDRAEHDAGPGASADPLTMLRPNPNDPSVTRTAGNTSTAGTHTAGYTPTAADRRTAGDGKSMARLPRAGGQ